MMQILVVTPTPEDFEQRVASLDAEVTVVRTELGHSEYEDALLSSEVIVGRPPPEDVVRSRAVRWLQLPSAGANRYVGQIPRDIILTSASGVYGAPAAEHVFALLLAFARSIPVFVGNQLRKSWSREGRFIELSGSTCGVLGLGDIGSAVAKRAAAFGMRVLGARKNADRKSDLVDETYSIDQLDEMLGECDFVINTLPATTATTKLIDASRLRAMKRGSFLVNIGRGSTIDETALTEALQSGHLGGAGLDVFEEEPLSSASPLWEMENVIITPHVGGLSPRESERVADLFLDNLERYLRGDELLNRVDPRVGY